MRLECENPCKKIYGTKGNERGEGQKKTPCKIVFPQAIGMDAEI
jgi:hypothetical protein